MNTTPDYTDEDVGNIVLLEHVNLQVPDQPMAILFYVVGLGLTRDPYLTVGLENTWINVGEQQFHLPSRPQAQIIPGHIGVVVPDPDRLQSRFKGMEERFKGTQCSWSVEADHLAVTCPWGNRFRCYSPSPRFGEMTLGIPYVEFEVRPGAAKAIGHFYQEVMGAPCAVESEKGVAARVGIGRNQWLLFRETDREIPPYDGHHIAVYVANFSGPYGFLKRRDLIMEDVQNHQFRFRDIVAPDSGKRLFEIEHEVRSLRHPMYHRPFVNRNPEQVQRNYKRGRDALIPFAK